MLKDIRNITYNLHPNKNSFLLAFESLYNLFHIRHKEDQTCVELKDNVTAMRGVLKHLGIYLGNSEYLVNFVMTETNIDPNTTTLAENSKYENLVIKQFYAMLVCWLSNKDRYGEFQRKLDNLHSCEVDEYPKTMAETITTLTEYRPPKKGNAHNNSTVHPTNANVSFSNKPQHPQRSRLQTHMVEYMPTSRITPVNYKDTTPVTAQTT